MRFKLFREGEFTIPGLERQDGRCGITGTPCHYSYRVDIGIPDQDNLLPNGFIVDVDDIKKYFEDTYEKGQMEVCPCCEEMAQQAVEFFTGLMDWRATKIKVLISPGAGRGIEAGWELQDV